MLNELEKNYEEELEIRIEEDEPRKRWEEEVLES